nr:hypothetical protein [Luteolibacter pohnpeiensis]
MDSATAATLVPVFSRSHAEQALENHTHLLGIVEAYQPANIFDREVGSFEEKLRPSSCGDFFRAVFRDSPS